MAVQKGYRGLLVWQKSFELSVHIYKLTKGFPKDELFGLTQQMRRCSISIPSNLAEGYGRQLPKSFLNFIRISSGSLNELETQLLIAEKLTYVKSENILRMKKDIVEIRKMLHGLIRTLISKTDPNNGS